jgi:DNA-binding XRE family transcriptional regulator
MDFGYSAFELALELGVYESTIYKWEKGESSPTPKHTQTIIEFMGYDPRLETKTINYEFT